MPMPKRFLIFSSIGVALCVAVGIFVFATRTPLVMEEVFPAQAIFYARLDHVAQHVSEAGESSFWKNIASIDVSKVLTRNNVPAGKIKDIQQSLNAAYTFAQNPWAQKIFGKQIAAGYYENGSLLAVRLAASLGAAEILSHFASHWSGAVTTSQQNYKGITITTVRSNKKSVAFKYVRLRDVLVAAPLTSAMLERVIDVYLKNYPNLKADTNFTFITGRAYPANEGLMYVNAPLLQKVLKQKDALFLSMAGIKSYGISFLPGDISRWKLTMGSDPIFSCPSAVPEPLRFVPPGIIAYQWGGCYDFMQAWAQAREQAKSVPEMDKKIRRYKHRLEKFLGVGIASDILPLLGNEAGGYITDVDTTGVYPYPRFLFFLKINDRAKVEKVLATLTQHPIFALQDEDYAHAKIRYMVLHLGTNMDPGYSFIGDYLLFSTSRQLLKKSIDTAQDPARSLAADKTAQAFGLSPSEKVNAEAFVHVATLAERLRGLLGWMDKYMSSQVTMAAVFKKESEHKKKEIAQVIAAKTAEITLAEHKIQELQAKTANSEEDPAITADIIENLRQEIPALHEEIRSYAAQRVELDGLVARQQVQAESAKLWMFNSEQVGVPLLKSLETFKNFGMKMNVNEHFLETEVFLN